jgi:hypothetical protein
MRAKFIGGLTAALFILALSTPESLARGGGHSSSYSSHSYSSHSGDHAVHGYTRKDGTHVAPHHATNPNHTKNDNYSTRGNVNPYTGKAGTKPRDGEGR